MSEVTAGFATLDAAEARRVVDAHPHLLDGQGGADPVVAILAAVDEQEMAALAGVLAAARVAFRMQRESAEAILKTLLQPERLTLGVGVMTQVHRDAELRAALVEEFGLLSGSEVAERAGSRATNARALASSWRTAGRILAVPADQTQRFPGFQFDQDGQPRPVVADVIEHLASHLTAWELALWFIGSNSWLGGERPVDVLDEPAEVVNAAQQLAAELRQDASGAALGEAEGDA